MLRFEYHEPRSLAEAIDLLVKHGDDAALLAGGTALLVDMKHGERRLRHLISLWGIAELAGVRENDGLHIGALTTITDLAESVTGRAGFGGLLEAARLVGPRQVQNVATIGGNICQASPGADLVPPLLCLDARLCLAGPVGKRTASLDGFLTGPDRTALRTGEVLTEIAVPPLAPQTGTAFFKVMRRHAMDCSIVSAAALIGLEEDRQTCARARIAIGAAAPYPFRPVRAEGILAGSRLEPDVIHEAARRAREESRPIGDVRASADYRRALVETLVERAVLKALERAAQEGERR